ncbi:MAG TPA: DUF3180 domain-containing protein [Pseudolysinimonas sp.]|nr:DUF3180 domain-containing protein [Pseudolysinimonas sp.]
MKRSRPGPLIGVGVFGVVGGILVQMLLAAASLAKLRPEYSLAITLVFIAGFVIVLALPIRRAVRGAGPVDPFYATRVVVLAKASSLCGALLSGGAAGFVLELVWRSGSPGIDSYLRDFAMLGGAVILLVAGLVAEFFCAVPPRDDSEAESVDA